MSKKIVAIDVDDTLAQHLDLRKLGLSADTADVYKMDWSKLLPDPTQISPLLIKAAAVFRDLLPMDGAYNVLTNLESKYDFIVMTARPQQLREVTDQWIDTNFPGVFKKKYFSDSNKWSGGNELKEGLAKVKAEVCQREDVTYLIDDQLVNCQAVVSVGVQPILFGDFTDEIPEDVLHASNWDKVSKILENK